MIQLVNHIQSLERAVRSGMSWQKNLAREGQQARSFAHPFTIGPSVVCALRTADKNTGHENQRTAQTHL
jgi:hypothetical protein